VDDVGTDLLVADNAEIPLNCEIGTVRKCRTGIGVSADADDGDCALGDTATVFGFGLTGGRHDAVDGRCCIGITTESSGFWRDW